MKQMLALFFFLPFMASAQECKLNKEIDPYTKEIKISSGFIFLNGGSVTIDADSKEIDVLFSVDGTDKCFDNTSTASIFFEGVKTKMLLRNTGTMNCEGLFHFVFRNTPSTNGQLQRVLSKKITHIIFIGSSKKEIKVEFGPKEQEAFMTLGNCVITEAKPLIK